MTTVETKLDKLHFDLLVRDIENALPEFIDIMVCSTLVSRHDIHRRVRQRIDRLKHSRDIHDAAEYFETIGNVIDDYMTGAAP